MEDLVKIYKVFASRAHSILARNVLVSDLFGLGIYGYTLELRESPYSSNYQAGVETHSVAGVMT